MRTVLRIVVYIALALSIGAAALAQDYGQTKIAPPELGAIAVTANSLSAMFRSVPAIAV